MGGAENPPRTILKTEDFDPDPGKYQSTPIKNNGSTAPIVGTSRMSRWRRLRRCAGSRHLHRASACPEYGGHGIRLLTAGSPRPRPTAHDQVPAAAAATSPRGVYGVTMCRRESRRVMRAARSRDSDAERLKTQVTADPLVLATSCERASAHSTYPSREHRSPTRCP